VIEKKGQEKIQVVQRRLHVSFEFKSVEIRCQDTATEDWQP
jgi:hypothetical protein